MSLTGKTAYQPVVEELRVLQDQVRVLASGEHTAGRYEMFEVSGEEGSGPPPHGHPWDEDFLVLDGEVDVLAGMQWRRLRTGEYLRVPAGVIHAFRVVSKRARFLAVTSPGGASEFFRSLHQAALAAPLTVPRVLELAKAHRVYVPTPDSAASAQQGVA